ncbi:hypothetical protein JCM10908_001782 [Rhodotorula pacifica]|uniref:uncharacterized protein n=1 Tax=Rhodotorula pacifica TaxID=1495444 RepID=UPI00316F2CE8
MTIAYHLPPPWSGRSTPFDFANLFSPPPSEIDFDAYLAALAGLVPTPTGPAPAGSASDSAPCTRSPVRANDETLAFRAADKSKNGVEASSVFEWANELLELYPTAAQELPDAFARPQAHRGDGELLRAERVWREQGGIATSASWDPELNLDSLGGTALLENLPWEKLSTPALVFQASPVHFHNDVLHSSFSSLQQTSAPPPPCEDTFLSARPPPKEYSICSTTERRFAPSIVDTLALPPLPEALHSEEGLSFDSLAFKAGTLPTEKVLPPLLSPSSSSSQDQDSVVRSWFPSFPGIISTDWLVEQQAGSVFSSNSPAVPKRHPAMLSLRLSPPAGPPSPKPLPPLPPASQPRFAAPEWDSETSFFGPWTNGEADLLDSDLQRVTFTAPIDEPAAFSYDENAESWITYRRTHISLDISLTLPFSATSDEYSRLRTAKSATSIERFEVEVTGWSSSNKATRVELLQLDKERVLSRATPLARQVLRSRDDTGSPSRSSRASADLEEDDDGNSNNPDSTTRLSTHFRRVHYAHATANHPRHYQVREPAFVMRVSIWAIQTDGSESVLGGWTSAPHLVRGRSRNKFPGSEGSSLPSTEKGGAGTEAKGAPAEQKKAVKRGRSGRSRAAKRQYPSAEFIEDSE